MYLFNWFFFSKCCITIIEFQEQDLGVICAAGHALGILTNRGPFDWHVALDETKEQGRLAAEYCKKQGVELGKLAMWYSAQLKGPATFLAGMATQEILNVNLDSIYNGLTSKEMDVLKYCLEKYVHNNYIICFIGYFKNIFFFNIHLFSQILCEKITLGRS